MTETSEELGRRLEAAIAPGFRERLLDRGLARGLIWRDGTLPPGAPAFADSLTEDLLDYAHSVLAMALRLRSYLPAEPGLQRSFLVAGEAIEAAVHRGDDSRRDRGFNRVSAAVAFHLGRYAARSYSILPASVGDDNLAPTERALVHLLRRSLEEMHTELAAWLLNNEHQDTRLAERLREDDDFDETDVIHTVVTTSFMRGLAWFDHAIMTGEELSAEKAKQQLLATAQAARDLHAVSHWWTSLLASHLIDELWELSLHRQLPLLPSGKEGSQRWNSSRRSYIQRLRAGRRAAIELWPSQLEAARRSVDPADDLVAALPTSAGKTRIAEMCILRALASGQRIIYVTPLRALSAQVERDLGETFLPLGVSVSSLYGSAGIEIGDAKSLRDGTIVVSTPEKLDFALRNDPSIIDDVGLVVLDEGHMLGPNEREVRYEALVQRLLQRSDGESRRIVCLSALFPKPEEMKDLVAWIRRDEPGEPVHSAWRPTRQRFGTLRWLSGAARLDVKVQGESAFVHRFVESWQPPQGSRRQTTFPRVKNELTLAAAWRFVEQEKDVLVYCCLRKSVESLGNLVLKSIRQGLLKPLRELNPQIRDAMATGAEWLGADHPAVQCLHYGVALHHGGLPRPFLSDVEQLLRSRVCPVTIASPTLAQGVNLSASVLLVPSIWRNQKLISAGEFANVTGRAGRAFVDIEGLVLHVIWEDDARRRRRAMRNWEELVAAAEAPRVASGLLVLSSQIYGRIAAAADVPLEDVVEYVTGHADAWDFNDDDDDRVDTTAADWERDIASLDAAILALLDAETEEDSLNAELEAVLAGSLFSRQLAQREEKAQALIRGFLKARAHRIWSQTDARKRKGYHVAGIGLRAGQFLDANMATLVSLLVRAEAAVVDGDVTDTAEAIVKFAELVFQTAPFRASGNLPETWQEALRGWIEGQSAAEVIRIGGEDGVGLLQETLTYRLPWAMEAVRVHAAACGHEGADQLQGLAALVVEAGSADRSVITLLRSGLSSREAAMMAVESSGASFSDRLGMSQWLWSDEVEQLSADERWPSAASRHAWLQFREAKRRDPVRRWRRRRQRVAVRWLDNAPDVGTHVVIQPGEGNKPGLVLTPDFVQLGVLESPLTKPRAHMVDVRVGDPPSTVTVEFFGPQA